MNAMRLFGLFILSCSIVGCFGSNKYDEEGNEGVSGDRAIDVQVQGEPTALAKSQLVDYFDNTRISRNVIELDDFGLEIVRTQAQLFFRNDATVAQINHLLDGYKARIVASVEGVNVLIVSFPDPGTLIGYQEKLDELLSESLVTDVFVVSVSPEPDVLPEDTSFINTNDLFQIDHHLGLNFHAAWNMKDGPWVTPQVVVADYFGLGTPASGLLSANFLATRNFSNTPHKDSSHGYHVLGILGHVHNSKVGGALPFEFDLDVVDLAHVPTKNNYQLMTLASAQRLATASKRVVVINLSLGTKCKPGGVKMQCAENIVQKSAIAWIKLMRAMGLENKALVVAAAGNTDSGAPSIVDGVNNSAYTYSVFGSDLEDSEGVIHPPLSNTLIVENAEQIGVDAAGCVGLGSFRIEGAIAGIGTRVFSLDSAGATYSNKNGTSMATPQVAGLAAYISAIKDKLSPQEIIQIIADNTKTTDTASGDGALCGYSKVANLIQPFETLLALDDGLVEPNAFGEDPSSVRRAMLDVNDQSSSNVTDMVFDSLDIGRFVEVFNDNEGIPEDGVKDYGRFDLNGDKYSKSDRTIAFDLNANGLKDDILTIGEGDYLFEFDERNVSDWDVLCYYAYSPLYEGDPENRELFLEDFIENCDLTTGGKIYYRSGPFRSAEIAAIDVDTRAVSTESHISMGYALDPSVNRSAGILAYVGRKYNYAINEFENGVFFQSISGGEPSLIVKDAWSFSIVPGVDKIVYEIADEIFISNFDGTEKRGLLVGGVRDYPAMSPEGNFLAYTQYNDIGDYGTIQLMDLETGAHLGAVSHKGAGEAYNAAWSPDSRYIAYELEGSIYVADLETNTTTRLNTETDYRSEPTWSPDGKKIAFSFNGDIYTVNLDGSGRTNITLSPGVYDTNPYWSY